MDPKCLLHGCTSNKAKDIQEHIRQKQIEQAVLMALENTKAPSDPEVRGNTSMAASSSTTRTNPPPSPIRPKNVSDLAATLRQGQRRKAPSRLTVMTRTFRTPSTPSTNSLASASKILREPTGRAHTPTFAHDLYAFQGTTSPTAAKDTGDTEVSQPKPEWTLPQLPTASRIIRGLTPIEAGAARAIPPQRRGVQQPRSPG